MSPTKCHASVVVATRNRLTLLEDLLRSLAKADPSPAEVVVVDDGSRSPVSLALQANDFPFELKIIRNEVSLGPGGARNLGVHSSRGDLIAFTDDDCVVESKWLEALTQGLEEAVRRGAGGVGGRVLAQSHDAVSRYMDFHRILEPRPHDASNPLRIPYLVTANCAVTREAFMRAGGFDESIPFPGGEDAAFSMRMVKQGYFFEHVEGAVVYHKFRPNFLNFMQTFYRYGLGGRYVVDRYLSG